jgi:hypothetical protein
VLILQFGRQVFYEAFFTPNYQIFFSAYSRKFRGRNKSLLEGTIKPVGIASAGFLIMLFHQRSPGELLKTDMSTLLLASSAALLLLIYWLGRNYRKLLLEEITGQDLKSGRFSEIHSANPADLLSFISSYINNPEPGVKRLIYKALA